MNLHDYDAIVLNSSGGKDSQAMIDRVCRLAMRQDFPLSRITVAHADLGRVEWAGTKELAQEQARCYGLRFEVIHRPQGDLLRHVEERGKWPSSTNRYCTSDHKRGQIAKVITMLADEVRNGWSPRLSKGQRVKILNCLGFRAEESPARAKRPVFENDGRLTNGRRIVDTWLPIHEWTLGQVWKCIGASGAPHHRAYDLGMPRLSCCFCIFAPKAALVLAAKHNPDLCEQYVRLEEKMGHTFRVDLTMAQVQREAIDNTPQADIKTWQM